jgi:mRNA interferase RelE/StbE
MYKVFLTEKFKAGLNNIPQPLQKKITEKIKDYISPQVKLEPHFGINIKKLRDWSEPTWRYRIGNFRLFYRIDEKEKVVVFISITDRKNAC